MANLKQICTVARTVARTGSADGRRAWGRGARKRHYLSKAAHHRKGCTDRNCIVLPYSNQNERYTSIHIAMCTACALANCSVPSTQYYQYYNSSRGNRTRDISHLYRPLELSTICFASLGFLYLPGWVPRGSGTAVALVPSTRPTRSPTYQSCH